MDLPDATLVEQVLAGQTSAFAALVHRHQPALIRLATLLTGDRDEADNIAQETLTRAFAQLAGFRPELSFSAWVHGIALNLCRNHLRARSRHAKLTSPEQLAEAPAREGRRQGALSGILRQEMNEHALAAIGQLPAPLREAFVLHFMEDLSYPEMAQVTGLAAGTLRVRAHRARTLLRNSLGSIVDTWMRPPSSDEST
jgi:RNA polymerase sigma-70 factor (ECF subfamily)